MADRKIEDATRVSSVDGTEILPASVGSAAKSLTTEQIKTYVLDALTLVTGVETMGDTDPVFIVNSNSVKKIPLDDLVDKVAGMLFDKTAVDDVDDDTIISVEDSGTAKTATMAQVLDYIEDNIADLAIYIHSLTAADIANTTDELAAYQTSAAANRKVTVAQLAETICGQTAEEATTRNTAIESTDYLLIGEQSSDTSGSTTLKKVQFSASGLDTTNKVTAPSSNSDGYVPQWNGRNSKLLKNGLEVVATTSSGTDVSSNINSSSTNDQVPTAAAVYQHGLEVTENMAIAPETTTEHKVPQWDDENQTLKDGLTVQSTVRVSGVAADTALPTEAAVRTALSNYAVAPNTTTSGSFARWSSTSKTLTNGPSLVTTVGEEGSDSAIPTEAAVRTAIDDAVDGVVTAPATTTENKIPQWDSTDGSLRDGLTLETSGVSDDHTKVPSSGAVHDEIETLETMVNNRSKCTFSFTTSANSFSDLPDTGNVGDFYICGVTVDGSTSTGWFLRYSTDTTLATKGWFFIGYLTRTWPTT